MICTLNIPKKVQAALAGMKDYKKKRVLSALENKIKVLFTESTYMLFRDIHNYTFFNNFLTSFSIVKNNEKIIDFFFDEEELKSENYEFEDSLFSNEMRVINTKQDNYIEKCDDLKIDIETRFDLYLSNCVWEDFKTIKNDNFISSSGETWS